MLAATPRRGPAQHAGDHHGRRCPQGLRPRHAVRDHPRQESGHHDHTESHVDGSAGNPSTVADPIIELISQGMGKYPAAEVWKTLVSGLMRSQLSR
jgi:hypothetical protein